MPEKAKSGKAAASRTKSTKKATKKTTKKTAGKSAAKKATTGKSTKAAKTKKTTERTRTAASGTGKVRVRQIRSGIGHAETYRRTLRALGLKHHQDEVVLPDNASVRGMVFKVRHLIRVTSEEV
jgi:large subunit ribosomal protein L30